MIKEIIYKILLFFGIIKEEKEKHYNPIYKEKYFMTLNEIKFYETIKELKEFYEIVPQINLATIIKRKDKHRYHNELFRNIDFAIFTKDYKKLLLLIELNDESHNKINRKDRDLKVKKICNDTQTNLITFYTKYPNEKEYVINRIKNEIQKKYPI